MNKIKVLICGSRQKNLDKEFILKTLSKELLQGPLDLTYVILEGCCPRSADEVAEEFAKANNIEIKHFPATAKSYLRRNSEMVKECDRVVAFYDGFSYGTAQTLAQALLNKKEVKVYKI